MSKYSIILPVRNGGEYVKECVHSILAQTLPDFNLLVLDNQSTDGSREWINSLQDDRITIYPSASSLDIVGNWARIKDIPKNEFITLIGHDDLLHPHYLEEMDRLIQKHPTASLYQAHYNFINHKGDHTGFCLPMDEVQYGHEFLACQMARTMNSMGTGYMMRASDYDALGGMPMNYPNLIFADYELWVRLTLKSFKATTDRLCFSYRIHQSASTTTNGQQYQEAFEKYVYFMAAIAEQEPKVKQVVEKYGYDMLMYFCESLSHRLLKTKSATKAIGVAEFINKCKTLASVLIPGQAFEPEKKMRISLAKKVDATVLGRSVFYLYKKIIG